MKCVAAIPLRPGASGALMQRALDRGREADAWGRMSPAVTRQLSAPRGHEAALGAWPWLEVRNAASASRRAPAIFGPQEVKQHECVLVVKSSRRRGGGG